VKDKDIPAFEAGLASHAYAPKVEADLAESAKVGVRGTPAAFVNGVLVSGAQPYDAFKKVIDEQLAKAKAALAAGAKAEGLYVSLSQENAKNPPPAKPDAAAPEADAKTVHAVPLGNAPALGRADAPVTIVAFSDFQCPFCKRAEDTIKQVRDAYGDKVRVVWRDAPLPFHNRALPAANLAREARAEKGDAAFWQAHDAIFASAPALEDADLERIGASLKLDAKKVASAIASNGHQKAIDEDKAVGDGLSVSGTPAFFINGRSLVGAQPLEAFKAIIDEEIIKGEALKAKGVKDVYGALTDAKAPSKS
jgi:protein-disulfide isomerase